MTDHIVWFDRYEPEHKPFVGGKNSSLGEMMRAELPVPPGFAVTTNAYGLIWSDESLVNDVNDLLRSIDHDDLAANRLIANQIRSRIEQQPVPDQVANDIAEATDVAERAVDGLTWPGRPLAAGHAAVLDQCRDNDLVRLWQLIAVLREWRGDGHIALLTAEPLSGSECTVITYALSRGRSFLKASRSWSDDEWSAAVERLVADGWISAEDAMTDDGKARRRSLETRTNELAVPMWDGIDDATVNRLGDLLEPAVEALTAANYFAMFGRPAPSKDG